ncbi:2-dehydro-3-deoxy-6-phosphogalactonate aldolase [Sphingomonas solaris]|uniref:2-dehydro-3-deoxy-6-phosphogalactonate aldolase n=1 Tax=Alterirhizorhabdus solaris TaxID=2529389 RepID=A0A558QVE4_9SPHN|nr:2-dehydro-3-deoxy-6-phosphogalactonate aldolase [Sphingomonas solaris]TVV71116.1 2-dehydro-3-deoxy-6-phosphogalactonate aldolase [Sphingomonas solaris]
MRSSPEFDAAMARCPLVAILRGVRPDEIEAIGDVLVEAGFSMIEVPLNSPDPLASIARIAGRYGDSVLVGAGTVLQAEQVEAVRQAGGRLIVSPNTDTAVIRATAAAGMVSLPGYFTPSEAFAAIAAGATGLKLFPAEAASPAMVRAQRAVLPREAAILIVGGIKPDGMAEWRAAGANGFGLGSALYAAGLDAHDVRRRAEAFIAGIPPVDGARQG